MLTILAWAGLAAAFYVAYRMTVFFITSAFEDIEE